MHNIAQTKWADEVVEDGQRMLAHHADPNDVVGFFERKLDELFYLLMNQEMTLS